MSNTEHQPEIDLSDPSSFPAPPSMPPREGSSLRRSFSEAQDADEENSLGNPAPVTHIPPFTNPR